MRQKIQLLPEKLCNQIAAGEVVERPSSVVKELVENSLDAGATQVRIEVEKGGRSLIRVTDDGMGMGREDAFLCFERHATSKISTDEDLFRINTLGFRGEALPSIAAVSRLTLKTREKESLEGIEIYLEGGTVRKADAVGMPSGTMIEVRNLFFNLPARRKFLRKEETELGHIGDVVTKLALGRPDVQFRLSHNGRILLDVYRHGNVQERVLALLGRTLAQDLVPFEVEEPGIALSGLLSQPSANRSTTGSMYAFVNGRFVRDRVVQHAVLDGYRNLLFKGRYPISVIFMEIDPELVDVNVHPTKHEVRFREQARVHDLIANTVRDSLRPANWLSKESSVKGSSGAGHDERTVVRAAQDRVETPALQTSGLFGGLKEVGSPPHVREPSAVFYGRTTPPEQSSCEGLSVIPAPVDETTTDDRECPEAKGFFASLAVVGQYKNSYILCQDVEDLVLIDQHAAHERIGFERLKAQVREGGVERQALLFPEVLELEFREAALLTDQLDELARLGFDVEPFGGNAFVLKSIPQLLQGQNVAALVRDVAGELAHVGKSGLLDDALDSVLILMACHTMVRANQRLSLPQMEALLRDLDTVDFKGHCPHGRPVMIRLRHGEIEKMFKRA